MSLSSFLTISVAVGSLGLAVLPTNASNQYLAQLGNIDNIGSVTTSVLDRLGYDCQTVANVGIVCKKCKASNNGLTEKCNAYICDAVTKKCRKQKATLPNLP